MPTLLMIEPRSPNLHIFSAMTLPRLGAVLLGTLAAERGWTVEVVVEEQREVDWERVAQADLVGISTITSTAPRAYAMADRTRALGVPVILGGPHVTFLPGEAALHGDWVMRGEAELAWPLFLEEFLGAQNWFRVPNLSWCDSDGELQQNEISSERPVLDELPVPDFNLATGEGLSMGGKRVIPIQTSRGCPFDCSFCSVTGMFGRRFRHRSTEKIMQELRQLDPKRDYIFFYDDNFMASPTRSRELLEAMEREELGLRWSAQVRADLARDREMVRRMRRAGAYTVFIGFESVNPASLKAIHKGETVEDLGRAAKVFREEGVHVHGMFILGLDDDTPETVDATIAFAKKHWISTAQFLLLTPLPGSLQYEQLREQGRISFEDWSLYDAHHVVFAPRHFTHEQLQLAQLRAHRKFYSRRQSLLRLLRGKWVDVGIAHYARRLNRRWLRRNRLYLRVLRLLRPARQGVVHATMTQHIDLDRTKASRREIAALRDRL